MNSAGTIDITELVEKSKIAFVDWSSAAIFADISLIPGMQWVNLPVISTVLKMFIKGVVGRLAGSAIMGAYFINTAIKKSSQAQDLIAAVDFKLSLPDNVSQDEYELAEKKQMDAFYNFVVLST